MYFAVLVFWNTLSSPIPQLSVIGEGNRSSILIVDASSKTRASLWLKASVEAPWCSLGATSTSSLPHNISHNPKLHVTNQPISHTRSNPRTSPDMPRKLPWGGSTSTKKVRNEQPSPAKRQRTTLPDCSNTHNAASKLKEEDVDLSNPVYMRPSDERYIMVEDEFLSIAQTYTRSVHRAEYERLQLLAKTKNATRISEIQRPVDGVTRMSKETLLKHELAAKELARQDILKGLPGIKKKGDIDDSDSDVERRVAQSVWGKSSLGMLMCSPKKRERNLSARWKINPDTRAAAGFKAAEVDGDAVKRRLFAAAAKLAEVDRKVKVEERTSSVPKKPVASYKPAPIKQRPSRRHEPATSTETEDDDDGDDDDDDDDDLDAPVVRQTSRTLPPVPSTRSASFPLSSSYSKPSPPYRRPTAPASITSAPPRRFESSTSSLASSPPPPRAPVIKKEIPPDFDFGLVLLQRTISSYRGRSTATREQAANQSQNSALSSSSPASQGQRPKLLDTLFPVKS